METVRHSKNRQIGQELSQLKALALQIKQIPVRCRKDIKRALLFKHKSLTNAAKNLVLDYNILGDTVSGRRHTYGVIQSLQKDLNLTDEQVLEFWPLLGKWPKQSKRRVA